VNIISRLKKIPHIQWQVFSKHSKKAYKIFNVSVSPINSQLFLDSMASSAGVLTNAGFGTTSEALFLKKKLMVIPMKKQYEQHCNAAMLKEMGVPVLKKLSKKQLEPLTAWVNSSAIVEVNYPDNAKQLVDLIVDTHGPQTTAKPRKAKK
jgi:uncharacterized protein (TIGR00661 family)